ncbi:iron-containing alcohol dehydrogenase [Amycolatopsis nivea]|uniref:iron-containing alcohol dehydrogenase n=1 Tax=Amycolatopsis nivea TaxID=1644109 RepID=UPI001430F224|nr:iron-containing alcohol dehydrogenase [Amycolatopsis nivea]
MTAAAEPSVPVIAGRGVSGRLAELAGLGWAGTLVVASRGTVRRLGLARRLPPGTRVFSGFRPNPTFDEAVAAAGARADCGATLVVGVGGGSSLDIAKAARALPPEPSAAAEVLEGRRAPLDGARLVLVPTTAGSGSEVTRFATLYRGNRKVSLDDAAVRADVALVDPALTDSCAPALTWSCAFDTLAHAVESLWSIRATEQSRDHAEAALGKVIPILREAGEVPTAAERDLLCEAATLAGRAIDITRTTAAHALAYPLTVHLGVPHGLACAMHLTWLAPMVERAGPAEIPDHHDPAAVAAAAATLRRLLRAGERDVGATIRSLITARGLPAECRAEGAPGLAGVVVEEGLASNRVSGTPVVLDRARVRAAVEGLLPAGSSAADRRRKGDVPCATTE